MHVNARAIIERETPTGREILLQVRNKPHEGGTRLELPGGRVEEYESLLEALQREVFEETGLRVTHIEGSETRVTAESAHGTVECLHPFAAYQTTRGPVDSMGIYFRCQAEGSLLPAGDDTLEPRWMGMAELAGRMQADPEQFDWVDRSGLLYLLQCINMTKQEKP